MELETTKGWPGKSVPEPIIAPCKPVHPCIVMYPIALSSRGQPPPCRGHMQSGGGLTVSVLLRASCVCSLLCSCTCNTCTRCSCAEPVSCHESSSLFLSLSLPIHRCTGERSWLSPVVGPSLHCWVSDRVCGAKPCQCLLVTILYVHCLNAPLYIRTYVRTYICLCLLCVLHQLHTVPVLAHIPTPPHLPSHSHDFQSFPEE